MPFHTDALIVGGGPAGLAAAISLHQRGLRATVVEARSATIDKPCGEGLMPGTLEALARLGVHVTPADGHLLRGIRFMNHDDRVEAVFPDGAGVGMRRPELHRRLAERAEHLGADLRWESHVTLPAPGENRFEARINGEPIRFRYLIGADGQASTVRRYAGLDRLLSESQRFGFRQHFQMAPWTDHVEIHWSSSGQVYVTPVAEDRVCVVYITRDRHCDRGNLFAEFPELAERLRHVPTAGPQRGAVSASRLLHRVATDTVALIGDASGSADSITGEGLALGFRQAEALALAIEAGSLHSYSQAHRRIAKMPLRMGALMLVLDRWPTLQRRALRALAASPETFAEILGVHVGADSLPAFALRRGPSLGWNMLLAPVSH